MEKNGSQGKIKIIWLKNERHLVLYDGGYDFIKTYERTMIRTLIILLDRTYLKLRSTRLLNFRKKNIALAINVT